MKRASGTYTIIGNPELAALIKYADAKTAVLLLLESRREYRSGGATYWEIGGAVERPRRTLETALSSLIAEGLITLDGATYSSNLSANERDTGQQVRQEVRQEAAKLPTKKAVQHAKPVPLKEEKEEKEEKEGSSSSLRSELKSAVLKSFDPTKLEFSNRLESIPEFAAIWLEWVTHRREIRKPLTSTSVKQQLEMLEAHPDPVACIRASLQGGYAGVFPERGLPAKSATQSSTSLTPRNGVNDKNYWAKVQLEHDAKVEAIINGSMA